MNRKMRMILASAALTGMMALAGCSGGEQPKDTNTKGAATPAAEQKAEKKPPIKIGAFLPLTGGGASLGLPARDGAVLAVEEVNKAGGINGRQIDLILVDDESSEQKAARVAQKLVDEDKVSIILGSIMSGNAAAAIPVVTKAGVPMVVLGASTALTDPPAERKFIFAPNGPTISHARGQAHYFKAKGWSKVGVIFDSSAFGQDGKKASETAAKETGLNVVGAESYNATDKDMTVQLTKLKAANPDVVVMWGYAPNMAQIVKTASDLKMSQPFFSTHLVASPEFVELAGPAANMVHFTGVPLHAGEQLPDSDPIKSKVINFNKAFQAKYNKAADSGAGHGYDAMKVIVAALEKVGEDPAKLRDTIEGFKTFEFVSWPSSGYSPNNHRPLGAHYILKIDNGHFKLLGVAE